MAAASQVVSARVARRGSEARPARGEPCASWPHDWPLAQRRGLLLRARRGLSPAGRRGRSRCGAHRLPRRSSRRRRAAGDASRHGTRASRTQGRRAGASELAALSRTCARCAGLGHDQELRRGDENMKALVAALVVLALAGCATVQKVDSGEQSAGERLLVSLKGPWNRVSVPGMGPAQIWTMEGLPIDQLRIYSGIKNDEALAKAAPGSGRKDFVFRSSMQPDEIVSLFEGTFTRDGSSFKLTKLEPTPFGGGKGFRFEYTLIR